MEDLLSTFDIAAKRKLLGRIGCICDAHLPVKCDGSFRCCSLTRRLALRCDLYLAGAHGKVEVLLTEKTIGKSVAEIWTSYGSDRIF